MEPRGKKRLKLRSEPMNQKVYKIICNDILDGVLPFGAQLSEKDIAADLGISRTPVREAMLRLQNEGLVEIHPQSGTYVFSPTTEDIINVCEMRLLLESAAIENAINRENTELVTSLRSLLEQSSTALTKDLQTCHRLDTSFHTAIIAADRNPFLKQAYTVVSNRIHALRQLLPMSHDRLATATHQHSEIIDAIEHRNADEAKQLIHQHIMRVQHILLDAVRTDVPNLGLDDTKTIATSAHPVD